DAKAHDGGPRVVLEMLDQPKRNRRAVSVIAEQDFGIDDIEILQMAAIAAEIAVEREQVLPLLKSIGSDEGVADRRGPDRQDQSEGAGSAKTASRFARHMLHALVLSADIAIPALQARKALCHFLGPDHRHAAIDHERLAVDEGGLLAAQEAQRIGGIVRGAHAPQWDKPPIKIHKA